MNILSLIYTKKISKDNWNDFFINKKKFNLQKRTFRSAFFANELDDILIKVEPYKVEIMYTSAKIENLICLLNELISLNDKKRVSIKIYNRKEKSKLMQLLNATTCYFL